MTVVSNVAGKGLTDIPLDSWLAGSLDYDKGREIPIEARKVGGVRLNAEDRAKNKKRDERRVLMKTVDEIIKEPEKAKPKENREQLRVLPCTPRAIEKLVSEKECSPIGDHESLTLVCPIGMDAGELLDEIAESFGHKPTEVEQGFVPPTRRNNLKTA